jgi:tRNA(His) 5'-end guanylyltransferase
MIEYEQSSSHNITRRIPVIIKIDGRSFSNVTKNIDKPFCAKTMSILNGTMLSLLKQIDGAIFGYQYSDKIIIVLRNDRSQDEDPWFGNSVQDMCSASASMATGEFMNRLWEMDQPPVLEGSLTFKSHVFGLPSVSEVVNYITHAQYCCIDYAINQAVYTVLRGRYGNPESILNGVDVESRKKILDEAGVEINKFPVSYRHGLAAYQIPKLVATAHGQVNHSKWLMDYNTPLFVDERKKISDIIKTGSDIFRPERDA